MLPKNEIYYEDMIDILESYKQYVPSQKVVLENSPPDSDNVTDECYVPVMLGGLFVSFTGTRCTDNSKQF